MHGKIHHSDNYIGGLVYNRIEWCYGFYHPLLATTFHYTIIFCSQGVLAKMVIEHVIVQNQISLTKPPNLLSVGIVLPLELFISNLFAGPIVEQATHFCDLVRYLGGEVRRESLQGICVPYSGEPGSAGYLTAVPGNISEASLLPSQRIPRFTTG